MKIWPQICRHTTEDRTMDVEHNWPTLFSSDSLFRRSYSHPLLNCQRFLFRFALWIPRMLKIYSPPLSLATIEHQTQTFPRTCETHRTSGETDFMVIKWVKYNQNAGSRKCSFWASFKCRWILLRALKGLCHQIRIAWKWYCFKGLGMDIGRLIFKIFKVSLQFLLGIWSSYA